MLKKRTAEREDPADLLRFCKPETVLLDAIRLWSQTPENGDYIRRLLAENLGADRSGRAFKAIKMFSHVLGLHARRTILLRRPGSFLVTADERALIALIGAQMNGLYGHGAALARWLTPARAQGTLLAVAGELGRAFRSGGLEILPPRDASTRRPALLRTVA